MMRQDLNNTGAERDEAALGFDSDLFGTGHRLGGNRPGPALIVSGFEDLSREVYERLMALPSLRFVKGTLYLMYTDKLGEDIEAQVLSPKITGPIDDVLFLPFVASEANDSEEITKARTDAFWAILAMCARYGMISGRGIQRNRLSSHPN